MTPITAVFFVPDAPVQLLLPQMQTMRWGDALVKYLDCKRVEPHETGLIRLTPKDGPVGAMPSIFVHLGHIAFMLQGESPAQLGFLTTGKS